MDITSFGHSSFRLRGKTVTVVTDPYDSAMVGLKFPKHITADIVTVSHDHSDHNAVSQLDGSPFIIKGPGEYEVKGVGVVGISVYHDEDQGAKRGRNTIYRIELDGISIVHLGDLGHPLSSDQIDDLDGVDVLLIPIGGIYTISAQQASGIVSDIEPSMVIPMHYFRDGLSDAFSSLSPVSQFLKEMGKVAIAPVPKITVTKDKLPEELQVIVVE